MNKKIKTNNAKQLIKCGNKGTKNYYMKGRKCHTSETQLSLGVL